MISDNTKEFIKEHAQPHGKILYKIENGKAKAVSRWIDSIAAEMACEIEREEVLRDVTIWIKTNLSKFDITDANGYTIDINDIVYFINQKLNTK